MTEWCSANLRGVEAFRSEGLHFSCTSDEAVKLFDALLRQLVAWTDCEQLGGMEGTVERMLAADPEALLPRAFRCGLELMGTGTSLRINRDLEKEMEQIQKEAASRGSDWERKHIQAIAKWGYGYFHEARALWEELLGEKPNDLLALKMAHDANFFIGDDVEMRNSLARALPQWKRDMPGYSYLHGMYAFGLEESGHYQEAEKHAVLALDMNRRDCWASHARAHVLEMTGRHGQGLQFLEDTEADWTPGAYLATHNFWHKALFHIELGKHQLAVDIFDQEVCPRTNRSCAMLDVVDASSLLFRLKMEGIEVGERWRRLPDLSSHATDHVTAFNDIHFGALFHGRGDVDVEQKMHSSLVNFTRSCDNDNAKVNQLVGQQLYEGVLAYMDEKYSTVVEKILPIRGDIVKIGGSHAQRDLFAQALVHACTRSTNPGHWELTPLLLKERAAIRTGTSPLAERILLHFREKHSL